MRWKDARSGDPLVFIEWATRLHDGYYPTASRVPPAMMCGCKEPYPECVKLAIHERGICTLRRYTPSILPVGITECPRRLHDYSPDNPIQSSHEGRAPSVSDGTTAKILTWTTHALRVLSQGGSQEQRDLAQAFLLDREHRTDIESLTALGEAMREL